MSIVIPFVDLERIHAPLRQELELAIQETLRRGDFILGEAVASFEAEFADYVGVEAAVGVSSGTAALAIAIAAAGIGEGDEVVVPAHTYIASALGVLQAGATPVFCDVDATTGLIDLDSAADVVGPLTAAIMAVHLYGQVCDLDELAAFAENRALAVIEDAAQAHGARWRGRMAGSAGTVSAFSFYPSKNLGAFGDAGMVCTDDPQVASQARRLRNLGQLGKGDHTVAGMNERLDTIQASVLRVKLPHLDSWNRSRREAADLYRERLPETLSPPAVRDGSEDVHHLLPVRSPDRDRLAAALAQRGIATGLHYSPAVHEQPPFADAPARTTLSCAESWAATELSLPMFARISPEEVETVSAALGALTEQPAAAAADRR